MATKARHLKTPLQLWIADNRKRLGLTSADLGSLTGVSEDTARGWESRGAPAEDRLVLLEHRFGSPAPRREGPADQAALIAALERQTEALTALVERLDVVVGPVGLVVAEWLRERPAPRIPSGPGTGAASRPRSSAMSR